MTTPTLHQAAQMALDALIYHRDQTRPIERSDAAITALREALSAPEPEPAAWKHDCAALCTNDVELWIDACPHCGKPRTAPPAAPADDHATPSGGQEAGPQEDRIEAAYWRFDARHKGYSQWKTAPMSERDAFKAEMRNALEAEKVRAEMRLVARGWRRPDAPAAPAPAVPAEDFCYCNDEISLQMVSGGAAPEGLYGRLTLKIDGKYVEYVRAESAAPPAAPAVPLTDEQIRSMWLSSEFRGNGGQVDWFCEGIRAAEAHHGITGGKP